MKKSVSLSVLGVVTCLHAAADARVVIDYVMVGNPGNTGEMAGATVGGFGPNRVCGAVDYIYHIAKYEVTNGQYIEFLNAVAATDTFGVYNFAMRQQYGGISRSGSAGSYEYGPKGGDQAWLNRPVNYISFWDAARFANWMHNGQPSGSQDAGTTEDGAYTLDGQTGPGGAGIARNPGARVFMPNEDEWYKAAYYDPSIGGGSGGYWDYTMRSDTAPTPESPPGTDLQNGSANYWTGAYTLGDPYWTAEVGAYVAKPSESPYGTYDQGGNQWEWVETLRDGSSDRGLRGGSFYTWDTRLSAPYRVHAAPSFSDQERGFRVATLDPPPAIPATSTWGLIVATLLILTAGATIIVGGRGAAIGEDVPVSGGIA